MGKVLSVLTRKINRFNVENRAHRLLEKEKLPPAPKYEANIRDMERTLEVDPNFVEKTSRKDSDLDDRLKKVYVTSKDSYIDYGLNKQDDDKLLPLDRSAIEDFEYGFKEPVRISPGRCSLRQAMKFITDYQADPDTFSPAKIADDYKIKHETVEKILTHFKSFQIHIPDVTRRENILKQSKTKSIESKENQT